MAKYNKIKLIKSILGTELNEHELQNIMDIVSEAQQRPQQENFVYYIEGIRLTYDYEMELTRELDSLDTNYPFTLQDIYKITLWKVNRFPYVKKDIEDDLMCKFNRLALYHNLTEAKDDARDVLTILLNTKGVRLPMASTYLRFRNPNLFQIIDQRVWRVVQKYRGETDTELHHSDNAEIEIEKYFKYIETLRELAEDKKYNIPFKDADRAFYAWDIYQGNNVKY